MAVNLSPVGGAAAQFFTNSGQVLTGGKLYTYLAGTTTPATTYTSNSGITASSNPIILNASGRVPGGEIWLTNGVDYKFILQDSNNVLIATYDNIAGINSSTNQQGYTTAIQGQTIVTVPFSYALGSNSLQVYVNGSKQIVTVNYTETTVTTVTFVDGLNAGDLIEFVS